jgi:hypothetical protein
MRVQDGAGPVPLDHFQMQPGFRGRPSLARHDAALVIDLQNAANSELALVQRAGRDREPQRVTMDDGAEVAARAHHPAA